MKFLLGLLLSIICVSAVISCQKENPDNKFAEGHKYSDDGRHLIYNAADFDDGKAKFFNYDKDNIRIKYFIIKSSDGIIRSAFDACDVCWRSGLGYYQDGNYMVCKNCGRKFLSTNVNKIEGGCNPSPLKRIIKNGEILISVDDIILGTKFFDFAGVKQ